VAEQGAKTESIARITGSLERMTAGAWQEGSRDAGRRKEGLGIACSGWAVDVYGIARQQAGTSISTSGFHLRLLYIAAVTLCVLLPPQGTTLTAMMPAGLPRIMKQRWPAPLELAPSRSPPQSRCMPQALACMAPMTAQAWPPIRCRLLRLLLELRPALPARRRPCMQRLWLE
jgi:hypothetical protein